MGHEGRSYLSTCTKWKKAKEAFAENKTQEGIIITMGEKQIIKYR